MRHDISKSIRYIGADDTTLDLFEGQYVIPDGISYNSYLILDEKVAIMDTVDARKKEEYLSNLKAELQGRQPDYLVVHHMEPDHASLISEVMALYPGLKVVAGQKALQMMPQFFPGLDLGERGIAVKEGDTLSLGSHCLSFVAAPMVHWPEVMVSYESSEKVLFSADGFGKFGALDVEQDWACEARRYYFNICGKYGMPVQTLLRKASKLDIQTICPLHGPILKGDLTPYLSLYDTWSRYEAESKGILVAYASIHGGTREAALLLADMLKTGGAPKVSVMDLSRCDMAEAIEDAFRYDQMAVAAPTYDTSLFPVMYDFLHHLSLKSYQKRRVAIIENGSWAPMAGKIMREMLSSMKEVEVIEPVVTIRSRMKDADKEALRGLSEALLERY